MACVNYSQHRPSRNRMWATCPRSASSGYHSDFHEGHGIVGEWQGRGMVCVLVVRNTVSTVREPGLLSRYSDSLRAGHSGDRIPVGSRFSAPAQIGPGAHPASYTMGTGSLPEVKRPGRVVNHRTPSIAEVKERAADTSTPPLGLRGLF
jgi:hypothetical protein